MTWHFECTQHREEPEGAFIDDIVDHYISIFIEIIFTGFLYLIVDYKSNYFCFYF